MGFLEVLKKEHVKILGVNKKVPIGISRSDQDKIMRNFMGFGFWSWNIQGVSHNFGEFSGMKLCFLQNFRG